ncbi:exported hypothetical protein [Cupriavidus taiwanensis]|nr:exported hypothetical protein [Cupriavidus taiwanensis]
MWRKPHGGFFIACGMATPIQKAGSKTKT